MIYIFAGGKIEEKLLEELKISPHDTVIAADGGVNVLFTWKLLPDLLIGDLDSASSEAVRWCEKNGVEIEKYPRAKDYTDLELALMKALETDDRPVVVFGAWGDRPDQTMVSFRLLKKYPDEIFLRNREWEVFLLRKSKNLTAYPGQTWSFLCAGDRVSKLTLKGFEYELEGYDVEYTETKTVSNVALGNKVVVSFESGSLFVFRQLERQSSSTKTL